MNDLAAAPEPEDALLAVPPPPRLASLELTLPPAAAARLWRTPALSALRGGRLASTRTRTIWHDTGHDQGACLIEIQDGSRTVWETQLAARDGTVRDGAVVWPLGTPAPHGAEVLAPDGDRVGDRVAVAVFEGHRRRLTLLPDTGILEVTLLDGQLRAGAEVRDIARLSLRGTEGSVFALARALQRDLPLAVAATGLSEEVQQMLHGPSAPPPPVLHADLDVDDAVVHIISQLAAAIAYHAPGARLGTRSEPVHQMRVALRRLRSALSLFRRIANSPELDRARLDLSGLARALGPARDWDVFLSGTGRDVERLLPEEKAVARMGTAARRRRRAAYATLAEMLDGPEFRRVMLDLSALAVTRPWRRHPDQDRPRLVAFARHALDRKLRAVTEAGEDLSLLPADALHAVRIRCKRLRYAAEFFAPLAAGRASRRFLRRLAAVQERLGRLNDGAVAAGLLAELGTRGFAAGIVHGVLAARTAGTRAKAERSWRRFRRTDPFWE